MKKVRLQKKLMALAVSVVLLIGCVGFTASAEEPAAAQNMEQNPYVAKYLEERGPVDEDSLLNNSEDVYKRQPLTVRYMFRHKWKAL